MGNLLHSFESNYLLNGVADDLVYLTDWNPIDIRLVQQKIRGGVVYFLPNQLKKLFTKTILENRESLIEYYFMFTKKEPKINMYEVLASLITYSASTIDDKIQMAFETFDFDRNHVITRDEMVILCISFMRGIAIMTDSSQYNRKFSEDLASEAFLLADTDPDGMLTNEELKNWVKSSQTLMNLLTRNFPKSPIVKTRRSIIEGHGFEITKAKARYLNENRLVLKINSPEKRTQLRRLSAPTQSESKKKLKQFFEFNKNARGKVVVKDFFEFVSGSFLSKEASVKLFDIVKGKFLKEMGYKDLRSILKAIQEPKIVNVIDDKDRISQGQRDKLRLLFVKYDLDSDGFLSLIELKKGLRDKFSNQTIETLFLEYDKDCDGKLTFDDFFKLCSPEGVIP